MAIKSGIRELLWMISGAIVLLVVLIIVWHFQSDQSPAEQLAFKADRVNLVASMRLGLVSASEAEKSAVMAITDKESQTFADQTRAATEQILSEQNELQELLNTGGTQNEKDLLNQFSVLFSEFRLIDSNLLDLAVRNTNLKASSLTFGPAAVALKEMDSALDNIIAKSNISSELNNVLLYSMGAQNAALRIQTMLPQHITEKSEIKMDSLEALIDKEDNKVNMYLDKLSKLKLVLNNPEVAEAVSGYSRYSKIRDSVITLSRENTNVISLSISLGEKRKVSLLCQDKLSDLQQTIMEEPIQGANNGNISNPRSLEGEK